VLSVGSGRRERTQESAFVGTTRVGSMFGDVWTIGTYHYKASHSGHASYTALRKVLAGGRVVDPSTRIHGRKTGTVTKGSRQRDGETDREVRSGRAGSEVFKPFVRGSSPRGPGGTDVGRAAAAHGRRARSRGSVAPALLTRVRVR